MPVDYRRDAPEWEQIRAAVPTVDCCELCGEVAPPGLGVCRLSGNPRNHEQQHHTNAAATVAATIADRRGLTVKGTCRSSCSWKTYLKRPSRRSRLPPVKP